MNNVVTSGVEKLTGDTENIWKKLVQPKLIYLMDSFEKTFKRTLHDDNMKSLQRPYIL